MRALIQIVQITEDGERQGRAGTQVLRVGDGNIPAGYAGAQARILKDGVLCDVGTWDYNDGPTPGMTRWRMHQCGFGSYSSRGMVDLYDGDGYYRFPTLESPRADIQPR